MNDTAFRDALAALAERGVLERATSLKVGDVEVQMLPRLAPPDKTQDRVDPRSDEETLYASA